MGATSDRHWMIVALLALFVVMFVLVPVADAATCAADTETPRATSTLDQPVQPDEGLSGDHALCAHGHCHHSGVVLPQPTQPGLTRAQINGPSLKPSNAPLASHSPGGLKRPPRV